MKYAIDNRNVVVVGEDHYNTLWLIRSLGLSQCFPDAILLGKDKNSFICKSKYLRSSVIVHNENELLAELKRRKSVPKGVILSSSDRVTKILDVNLEELSNYYFIPNCRGKSGSVLSWMNKGKILQLAQEVGINVPKTISVHITDNGLKEVVGEIAFPCLIKPQVSIHGSKEDFRICRNEEELRESFNDLKNHCANILVQQYIIRDYEFVINGVRYSDKHIIPGVVRKVQVGQKLNNMGMTVTAYTDSEIEKYIDVSLIKKMMDKIGFDGLYSIEFVVSKGIPYLLEINFRSDATVYISTSGGVNLPFTWYLLATGHNVSLCRYSQKAFGMAEISYVKDFSWLKPWKLFVDWWKTDCYSIFSWKDLKPFFYKFIYAI